MSMIKRERRTALAIIGILYMVISAMVVFGEYEKDLAIIKASKPFIIPLLIGIYLISTKKINYIYLGALLFVWLANLFFIFQKEPFIYNGAICYLIFWVFITFIILINTPFPEKFSFGIAIIPFAFVYCCVLQLIYNSIHDSVYLFFSNGVFMTFLGAYSLSNYFLNSSKQNTYLLISILLFTFIQFLVSIDLYYISMKIFRPLAMLLFVSAQYFLLKTIVSFDDKRVALKIKNSVKTT